MLEILAFVVMVALDQVVKLWAVHSLAPVHTMEVIPNVLHLTYVENTGAAFSILQGNTLFLIVIPILACAFIAYLLFSRKIERRFGRWALVLILSGAVGNLIDRIFRGAVVDLFEIRLFQFAIFNVADIFVTVGAVMLFIYILFFTHGKDA